MKLIYLILAILLTQNCAEMSQENITVKGTAMDAKAGAVVVTEDEKIYYLDGLDYWDEDVAGKEVEVKGELFKIEHESKPGEPISQGMEGTQLIIKNPTWVVL